MTDDTTATDSTNVSPGADDADTDKQPAGQVDTPPWGDDFDAEKAWKLVRNLRADKEKLAARPVLSDEQQQQLDEYNALVEASKTDAQRREEAANAAQRERDEAQAELTRLRIAMRHGISEEDFDLLGSGTEEEVAARALKIAAKNEAARQAALEAAVTGPATPAPRRPSARLQPGASPAPDPVRDDSYYPTEWLSPSQRAAVDRRDS